MNVVSSLLARLLPDFLLRYALRLRFPNLFLLMLVLFVADLLVPDFIPLLDEIMFGLFTLLLAAWKKRKDPAA